MDSPAPQSSISRLASMLPSNRLSVGSSKIKRPSSNYAGPDIYTVNILVLRRIYDVLPYVVHLNSASSPSIALTPIPRFRFSALTVRDTRFGDLRPRRARHSRHAAGIETFLLRPESPASTRAPPWRHAVPAVDCSPPRQEDRSAFCAMRDDRTSLRNGMRSCGRSVAVSCAAGCSC
jgi:hypothetical protein